MCCVCVNREDEEQQDASGAYGGAMGEQQLAVVSAGTASKLLDTGINTLQRTLMLKRMVEYDDVDTLLRAKREQFKQRMQVCAKRQLELQKRQQAVC